MKISKQNLSLLAPLFSLLLFAACGDEADEACPPILGEAHVTQAHSEPDGIELMLHMLARECPVTGENIFLVHDVHSHDDDAHGHSPRFAPKHDHPGDEIEYRDDFPQVQSVHAHMPAHGHGTAEPSVIDDERSHQFSVNFQMPGMWRIELELIAPAVTSTVQSVVFDVKVH
jgi:hypothetical protein